MAATSPDDPPGFFGGPTWPRIAPFAVFIALLMAEPYLADVVEPWLDPRWLYAVRSAVTVGVLAWFWGRYVELRGPHGRQGPSGAGTAEGSPKTGEGDGAAGGAGWGGPAGWVAGLALGIVAFVLWIALDVPWATMGELEPYDPTVGGEIHWGFTLTRLAGAALVVPVMEELFWRSFLMRWIDRRSFLELDPAAVSLKALLMTSAVFALEHRLWFAGLLAGLLYGELYRRTRDVRVVVAAHAVTNAALGLYVIATGSWQFW